MINPDLMPGKPVQTRSGLEAVIYAVHEGQDCPVHGAYKEEDGVWVTFARRDDGLIYADGDTRPLDIIPARKKLTGFINVYLFDAYETRERADAVAVPDRIACIDLASLNLTEGHGLTEGSSDDRS